MALQLYEDDLGPMAGDSPESSVLFSPMPADGGGIGMASPKPATRPTLRDDVRAEFQSLSPMQQVGAALSEFSAGVGGRASPLAGRVEARRKEKLMQMEELKGSVSALEHGVKMLEGIEGPERQKFIDTYAARLDGLDAGLGETYKRVADRPDLLSRYKEYLPELPEHLQMMARTNPQGFLKFAGTAEGVKALGDGLDRRELRSATQKVRTAMMGFQQLVPPEVASRIGKDNVITASEILELQQHLPEKVRLTDAQVGAIQRNDKTFWNGLGVLHGEKEQEVLANRAKGKENKAPQTKDVDSIVYQYDPDKKITGSRLSTDDRWVKMGSTKGPRDAAAEQKDVFDREFRLADDYARDTKKFQELRSRFDSSTSYMAERATNKTSAGDAALMYDYAKMRDPTDRLAVSETKDLKKLGNIFERIGASVTGVLDKGETLPDRVANEMYEEIRRRFTEQNRGQLKVEADFTKKTKDYGGNPERVVRPYAIAEKDLEKPKAEAAAGTYKDAGAVRAAFQAGKISREQAKAELKKFGFN